MSKFRIIERINGVVNYVRVRMIERLGSMDMGEVRVMREQGVAIGLHAGATMVREYLRALYGLDAEAWSKEAWKFVDGFCRAAECGLEEMELECVAKVVDTGRETNEADLMRGAQEPGHEHDSEAVAPEHG